jgi:uncharacterized protein YqeY
MTLKEQIQNDFVTAMKNREEVKKSALGMLKAKITETEKTKGNVALSDEEVIKVITGMVKQRKQSVEEFEKGNRTDLAEREKTEVSVLEAYLPSQMSTAQISLEALKILVEIGNVGNKQRLIGQTIGTFNKRFVGQADPLVVKIEIEKLVNEGSISTMLEATKLPL